MLKESGNEYLLSRFEKNFHLGLKLGQLLRCYLALFVLNRDQKKGIEQRLLLKKQNDNNKD